MIPSAGPYRVASYTPGQGVVLTRNPNYHGSRPHRLARIELTVGISDRRAVAQVEAGTADYAVDGGVAGCRRSPRSPLATARKPSRRERPPAVLRQSGAAARLLRSEHPPAAVRRRAAPAGGQLRDRPRRAGPPRRRVRAALPEHPTDHYLPPGVPGYLNVHIYPSPRTWPKRDSSPRDTPAATAVLYTCNVPPCDQQAQILKNNLAAIGLRVDVKRLRTDICHQARHARRAVRHRLDVGWLPDYPDPSAF